MLEVLEKVEAEKITLSCLLNESELLQDCALYPEHFSLETHRNLLKLMYQMADNNEPIDVMSVCMKAMKKIDKLGGLSYVNELASAAPSTSNFTYYQSIVLEQSNKRKIMTIANEILLLGEKGEDFQTLKQTLEKANEFDEVEEDDGSMKSVLGEYIENLYVPRNEINVMTGFQGIDNMIGGYKQTQLIIIGARPSVGKTAFALNELKNIVENQNNIVAFFSCEMKKQKIIDRLTCIIGNIHSNKMHDPATLFDEEDFNRAMTAVGKMDQFGNRVKIYDKISDIDPICRECRQLRRKNPDKNIVVMIDYLQLLTYNHAPKHMNRTQIIGHISRKLKLTALENNITIVALAQLSRDVEKRSNKRPTMADLRESGDMEQDADVIQMLYREDYHDKESEPTNIIEVITEKNRDGARGTVELAFVKEYFKFSNLEKRMS